MTTFHDDSFAAWQRRGAIITAQYAHQEYMRDLERRIAEDKKRKVAEREAALPFELRDAMMASDDAYVKFGRDLLEWHCRKHDIAIRYLAGFSEMQGRSGPSGIKLPAPMSVEAPITMAHEMGPRSSPHLHVEHSDHVMCEIAAWKKAFELIPFSEDMARSAADSLRRMCDPRQRPTKRSGWRSGSCVSNGGAINNG
jgi:hypothetical protein